MGLNGGFVGAVFYEPLNDIDGIGKVAHIPPNVIISFSISMKL